MQSFKVLVVEDGEPFRQFVCSTLRARAEFQLTEATDGLEAVQKAKRIQPDLILLDIGLPNLNGIEVCKCAGELAPAAKIIFLSQESSPDVVQECLSIAQGYIQKLHVSRDLFPAIDAVLKGENFVSCGLLVGKNSNSMRIGIDFGTTRIVAAAADRGNYPLVNFAAPDGRVRDWFPSLLAVSGDKRVYGWEALEQQDKPGWTIARSIKRWLKNAGPRSVVDIAGQRLNLFVLMTEMMTALRRELIDKSNLGASKFDRLQVMLGVPANANSNQRFLTQEAARAAGFEVLGLLNEPSAAAVEFAYRTDRRNAVKSGLLVYDLGGGTFDVSLVSLGGAERHVVASDGISDLGGDNFDEILALMVLATAGKPEQTEDSLTAAEWYLLFDECREKKEALNPNSRKITIDLERVRKEWREVTIGVDAFYERCRPLVEASRGIVEALLASHPERAIDTLYVTGGGSELPPVARILRETFGRRVRRSAYMRSATAIGLAIRAEGHEERPLRDQFTKNFGVWREADDGSNVVFDVIFPRGVKLPPRGEAPLRIVRSYRPAHNIGYFRYLECAELGADNQPDGEISNWDEIRVAFDPRLGDSGDLTDQPVCRYTTPQELLIEEEYSCDANGNVEVRIHNKISQQTNEYRLGRWSKHLKKMKQG